MAEVAAEDPAAGDDGAAQNSADESMVDGAPPDIAPAPVKKTTRRQPKTAPEPAPAVVEEPAQPEPPAPKSAAQLLAEAKAANGAGQGSKAYGLAQESLRKSATVAARQQMVIAACIMKDAKKARSSLRKIPLFQRRIPKRRCQALGVKL
jgi:outer membrane biosynthesis protein TonB